VSRVRKVYHRVEAIADEDRSFSKLRRAVVYGVHLEAIHVVSASGDLLKVVGEHTDDRPGGFVMIEWHSSLVGP
jgi:hypothetical protein